MSKRMKTLNGYTIYDEEAHVLIGDLEELSTEDKSSLTAAINEIASATATGLSETVKTALLQIFSKVAYIDEHGQDYYENLYAALSGTPTVILNSHSITLNTLGATSQLTARTIPEGGLITWTSSNPAVATVDQTGLVTSVANGTATITATSGTASDTCSVVVSQVTLSGITAEYTPSGKVYDTDALDNLKTDLVVTATWSDGSQTIVPSADYTLSGTLSTGSSVITASYDGKTASFTVNVVGLTSISATYTQSGTVYTDDSLDSLKPDLVVLKNYSDSSAETTTDYTLSGTLETGTSTITVTCAGFTDTFTVTVTASQVLYRLPQETTFNGSSDYIDTGVQLYKTDIDYTLLFDVTATHFTTQNETLLHCKHEVSPYYGLAIDIRSNSGDGGTGRRPAIITVSNRVMLVKTEPTAPLDLKIAITHTSGDDHLDVYWLVDNILHKETMPVTFVSIDETVLLGAYQDTSGVKGRYFAGTVHSFVINSNVASQTELNTFFGNTAPVTGLSASYSSSITLRAGSHPEYWVKPNVTALAMHSNGIGECISDFTISNTPLTVGTNTLTVSKDDYSDTITLEAIADDATYRLPAPVTFNGTSDYIDTGVQLLATDHDFSLALSWDAPIQDYNSFRSIARCYDDGTVASFQIRANRTANFVAGLQDVFMLYDVGSIGIHGISRMAVTYTSSSKVFKVTIYNDDANSVKTWTKTVSKFTTYPDTLLLGCKDVGGTKSDFFNGTLKDVTVFDRALSDAEITCYCTKT